MRRRFIYKPVHFTAGSFQASYVALDFSFGNMNTTHSLRLIDYLIGVLFWHPIPGKGTQQSLSS